MSNRSLGVIAMLCAPFLGIDFLVHGQNGPNGEYHHTSLSGLFCLVYMTGWLCSIIALQRLKATGAKKFGRAILVVQFFTLTLANIWNVYEIISPAANTAIYFILDLFWPISNLVLLIIGIMSARVGKLQGWKRYAPLMAGVWFPVSIILMLVTGQTYLTMILSGLYSATGWMLMGFAVYTSANKESANASALIPA